MEFNKLMTIRRISVGSAFKVGAALYAMLFAIIGLFFLLFYGLIASLLVGSSLGSDEAAGILGLFGGGFIVQMIFYVIGIVFYGFIGGVFSAISALFYNIVAGRVGGLEVDIS